MKNVEAPSGLEPLSKGFADLPLSHLGTAPLKQGWPLYSKRQGRASSCLFLFGLLLPKFSVTVIRYPHLASKRPVDRCRVRKHKRHSNQGDDRHYFQRLLR